MCVCRPVLDGCSGAGSEVFQSSEAHHDPRGQRGDGPSGGALTHQLLQPAARAQHAGLPVRTHTSHTHTHIHLFLGPGYMYTHNEISVS